MGRRAIDQPAQKSARPARAGFQKSESRAYNDYFDFVFETENEAPVCEFADSTHVRTRGTATTEPKGIPAKKPGMGSDGFSPPSRRPLPRRLSS
jgi:hypothetical protein